MTREQELIESSERGDAGARKALYSLYVRYLSAVCSRYITDSDGVKDVLQDSFIKIFQSLDKFEWRGEGSLKSWMTRIAVNECLKRLRDSRRRDTVSYVAEVPDVAEDDGEDGDMSAGDIPPEVIHSMIRELPEGYRTVFNLYVVEGLSHREIAEMLGIGEATSASQLHRAKKMLAGKIREYMASGK